MDIFNNRFEIVKARPKGAGIIAQVVGTDGKIRTFESAYNRVGSVLAIGQPITIDYVATYFVAAIANATTSSELYKKTGVALKVMQINELWWFQIGGPGKALVNGTSDDVVSGDGLEVINGATSFIKAGSARELATGAIALAAQAANSAVLVDVMLIPEPHSIEGS